MKIVVDWMKEAIYNGFCKWIWLEKFTTLPEGTIKSKELQQLEVEAQVSSYQKNRPW